jgi:hypothetical protein
MPPPRRWSATITRWRGSGKLFAVSATVPDHALCLGCNYPLRGLDADRCPECGRGFDPGAPITMNLGRPLDSIAIASLRPIGWWGGVTLRFLAWVGVLGPAWLVPSRRLAILWFLLWCVFIFACWCRSFERRLVVMRYRQPPECLRIDDPFRMRTRRTFVIVTLLILTRMPFLLAALISRPWLDRQAHYIWSILPANVDPPKGPTLQGLVLVRRIDAGARYVVFHLVGGGEIVYESAPDGSHLESEWDLWNDSF